ncbi:hypothetical protein BKA82DRAFT_4101426 [Pisolithus tinctorius]|nr:hypothetical protein BKA82DRAFT_4101426 [Pisolithus tinctorius]
MATKSSKEEVPDVESTRSQFIAKLANTADAMRKFSTFADTLAQVIIETLQAVVDATPTVSRKRKLEDTTEEGGKKRKREKKTKDPNAPKAPPSAYIMFQNDVRTRPYFDKVTNAKKNHEVDMAKYIAEHPGPVEEGSVPKKAKKAAEPVEKPVKKPASAVCHSLFGVYADRLTM